MVIRIHRIPETAKKLASPSRNAKKMKEIVACQFRGSIEYKKYGLSRLKTIVSVATGIQFQNDIMKDFRINSLILLGSA